MEQDRLTYLLEQYLADRTTEQERQELSDLLQADTDRELFNAVVAGMMQQETAAYAAKPEAWQQMLAGIVSIDKRSVEPVQKQVTPVLKWYRWAAAAAVLLVAGLGLYFFIKDKPHTDSAAATATAYKVISTVNGDQQEIVLPDGSRVWLNAASTIRFPASFAAQERSVELSGEAWFDVTHNDKVPFRIHSGAVTTTVIGTAFDIKAYPGQKAMIVSVQRGKVKVQAGNKVALLEKGQRVSVSADTTFHQSAIDTSFVAAWKKGYLFYKDETVKDIVADLQRVFNHPITIKSTSLKEEMVTVSFNKDIGLPKALDIICRITDSRLSDTNGVYSLE